MQSQQSNFPFSSSRYGSILLHRLHRGSFGPPSTHAGRFGAQRPSFARRLLATTEQTVPLPLCCLHTRPPCDWHDHGDGRAAAGAGGVAQRRASHRPQRVHLPRLAFLALEPIPARPGWSGWSAGSRASTSNSKRAGRPLGYQGRSPTHDGARQLNSTCAAPCRELSCARAASTSNAYRSRCCRETRGGCVRSRIPGRGPYRVQVSARHAIVNGLILSIQEIPLHQGDQDTASQHTRRPRNERLQPSPPWGTRNTSPRPPGSASLFGVSSIK